MARPTTPASPDPSMALEPEIVHRILVDSTGRVVDARIHRSRLHLAAFEEAALTTVKTWSFTPAPKANAPVPAWVNVSVSFLQEAKGRLRCAAPLSSPFFSSLPPRRAPTPTRGSGSRGPTPSAASSHAALGIPRDRLVYQASGVEEPVASNETPAGRAENRRVDVEILAVP